MHTLRPQTRSSWTAGLISLGDRVNRVLQIVCAALTGAMILIVWLGIASRYFFHLGLTWTEELSRYVMIWAALLAVAVGVYQREHIGFELLLMKLPRRIQHAVRVGLDLLAFAFFAFLAIYGYGMTITGNGQYATIFGMTMLIPFASVPVSSGLAAFQCVVALARDWRLLSGHAAPAEA